MLLNLRGEYRGGRRVRPADDAVTSESSPMNTSHLNRPTATQDLADISAIAEATALFPGDMLDGLIAGYLDGSKSDIWLTALREDRCIGFAFCEPERLTNGTWNLLAIGVAPEWQGRGVGASLMQALEATLRADGHRILIIDTSGDPAQARTRSFYLAKGYVEEARIREFWDVGADKVTYWKHL